MGKMSFFRHRRLFVRRKRADANGPRNEEIKTGEGNDRQKLKRFLRTLVFERAVCKVAIILCAKACLGKLKR